MSFHVARELAVFKGMKRLTVAASGAVPAGIAAGTMQVAYRLKLPPAWRGRSVEVTRTQVDDDANWFDEWRADRKCLGIGDDAFAWSPDDPAVMRGMGLTRKADRDRFLTELQPRYRRCAELKSEVRRVEVPANASSPSSSTSVSMELPWQVMM